MISPETPAMGWRLYLFWIWQRSASTAARLTAPRNIIAEGIGGFAVCFISREATGKRRFDSPIRARRNRPPRRRRSRRLAASRSCIQFHDRGNRVALGLIRPLALGPVGHVRMLGCEPHQRCSGVRVAGQLSEMSESTRLPAVILTPHAFPRRNVGQSYRTNYK